MSGFGEIGMGGCVTPGPKQSQVTKEFEVMGLAIEQLEKAVTVLAEHLSPVLRKDTSAPDPENEKPLPLVPLADGLRMFRRKVEALIFRVQDIQRQCEL